MEKKNIKLEALREQLDTRVSQLRSQLEAQEIIKDDGGSKALDINSELQGDYLKQLNENRTLKSQLDDISSKLDVQMQLQKSQLEEFEIQKSNALTKFNQLKHDYGELSAKCQSFESEVQRYRSDFS